MTSDNISPGLESDSNAAGRPNIDMLLGAARREIKVHCYRMLGSLHEAEDAVQEAFLRAWRSYHTFDGHGTFRAWLYKIATNVCFDALTRRKNLARILPDQHEPATREMPNGQPAPDVAWLEPYPQTELDAIADPAPSPEARISANQATRLAFMAAIQQLAPRQRAALLLCDVLGWSVAETADLIGGTVASINSALQRARAKMSKEHKSGMPVKLAAPSSSEQQLLHRYLKAWEDRDANQLAALLKDDAIYTMPPLSQWYWGRDPIRVFFEWAWKAYAGFQMKATSANGEPAFAAYFRSRSAPAAPWTAHSLHVLSVEHDRIARITLFIGPNVTRIFDSFGLPTSIPDQDRAALRAP